MNGKHMRRRGRSSIGPPKNCFCPKCNYTEKHKIGERCSSKSCPRCGTRMMGKW